MLFAHERRTSGASGRDPRFASRRSAAIEPGLSNLKLTREGVCQAFGLSPDSIAALEAAGAVRPGPDGLYDLTAVAAALFNYGMGHAKAANEKLLAAASALNDALPALQRLSQLPDTAALTGETRERVTNELAAFFNVFAESIGRATKVLNAVEGTE